MWEAEPFFAFAFTETIALPPETTEREEALARSRQTLYEHLTPQQCADFDHYGWFAVTGNHTGTRFRIEAKPNMNIYQLRGDQPVERWCFIPEDPLPLYDIMLMQKLCIELDERDTMRAANLIGFHPSIAPYPLNDGEISGIWIGIDESSVIAGEIFWTQPEPSIFDHITIYALAASIGIHLAILGTWLLS